MSFGSGCIFKKSFSLHYYEDTYLGLRVSSSVIYIHDFYLGLVAYLNECSNLSSHSLRSRQKSFSLHYHEDTYLGLRVSSPVIYIHDFYLGLVTYLNECSNLSRWGAEEYPGYTQNWWLLCKFWSYVLGTRHAEGWKFSEYTVWPQHTHINSDIPRTFNSLRAAFREHLGVSGIFFSPSSW